jgi:hypothetical protein
MHEVGMFLAYCFVGYMVLKIWTGIKETLQKRHDEIMEELRKK